MCIQSAGRGRRSTPRAGLALRALCPDLRDCTSSLISSNPTPAMPAVRRFWGFLAGRRVYSSLPVRSAIEVFFRFGQICCGSPAVRDAGRISTYRRAALPARSGPCPEPSSSFFLFHSGHYSKYSQSLQFSVSFHHNAMPLSRGELIALHISSSCFQYVDLTALAIFSQRKNSRPLRRVHSDQLSSLS